MARRVDDHHVFPKKHLAQTGHGDDVDSVLNHTYIDKKTNIRIGGNPRSEYLECMHKELGAELAVILSSHNLPPDDDGPLRQDRFEDFLRWRQDRLEHELIAVTGVSVR